MNKWKLWIFLDARDSHKFTPEGWIILHSFLRMKSKIKSTWHKKCHELINFFNSIFALKKSPECGKQNLTQPLFGLQILHISEVSTLATMWYMCLYVMNKEQQVCASVWLRAGLSHVYKPVQSRWLHGGVAVLICAFKLAVKNQKIAFYFWFTAFFCSHCSLPPFALYLTWSTLLSLSCPLSWGGKAKFKQWVWKSNPHILHSMPLK